MRSWWEWTPLAFCLSLFIYLKEFSTRNITNSWNISGKSRRKVRNRGKEPVDSQTRENTNRGSSISMCSSPGQVRNEVSSLSVCPETGQKRNFILQKYIENPLLINKRKFGIRCFCLITCINSILQAYFSQEGYLRTSSREFSLKDTGNRLIHLANNTQSRSTRRTMGCPKHETSRPTVTYKVCRQGKV